MNILVTGADGYIGQGLVKQLLDDGNKVIASGYKLEKVDDRAIKIEGDIFAINNPFEYFHKPDTLIHLAWRNGFVHNELSHLEDLPQHYLFLKNMLDGGLKHLAVMGTMHEVGFFEGSIKADTPTHPQSLYGIAKDALRNSTILLCKEHDAICQWIRAYYIVGNSKYGSSIFSKITQAVEDGKETFPFTMGQNQWDFINYDELCEQISAVIEQKEYTGIINVCSGYPQKLADRVEQFIKENNYKIKLDYGAFPDRPYDSKAVWGDNSTINKIMNKRNV